MFTSKSPVPNLLQKLTFHHAIFCKLVRVQGACMKDNEESLDMAASYTFGTANTLAVSGSVIVNVCGQSAPFAHTIYPWQVTIGNA